MSAAPEQPLRAADGRVPGRRGRATRDKLLAATEATLATTSYRDLKVVDIAREAGTSPATFYQYFPDVEAAILVVARATADDGHLLAKLAEGPWSGRGAFASAQRLAEGFLDFWQQHEAVIRVVDLAIGEGDERFRGIRTHLLNPVTLALRDAIAAGRNAGVDPAAHAAVLVSMLAHVAEHRHGLEAWGVSGESARDSMARILAGAISGRAR